jgi:hypothetical protein
MPKSPDYDVYIGVLKHRFGTPTGRYGSGTEKEYRDALKRWKADGSPWILFYFSHGQDRSRKTGSGTVSPSSAIPAGDRNEAARIVLGIRRRRVTGGQFLREVSEHLRGIVRQIAPSPKPRKRGKPPANPEKYLRDLLDKTGFIDIRGLVESEGRANRFPIEDLFISLSTSAAAGIAAIAAWKEKSKRTRSAQPTATWRARPSCVRCRWTVPCSSICWLSSAIQDRARPLSCAA